MPSALPVQLVVCTAVGCAPAHSAAAHSAAADVSLPVLVTGECASEEPTRRTTPAGWTPGVTYESETLARGSTRCSSAGKASARRSAECVPCMGTACAVWQSPGLRSAPLRLPQAQGRAAHLAWVHARRLQLSGRACGPRPAVSRTPPETEVLSRVRARARQNCSCSCGKTGDVLSHCPRTVASRRWTLYSFCRRI